MKELRRSILSIAKKAVKSKWSMHENLYLVFGGQTVVLKVDALKSGRIYVHQASVAHGIRKHSGDSFDALKSIISEGFRGENSPNVALEARPRYLGSLTPREYSDPSTKKNSSGDSYTLEIMSPLERPSSGHPAYPTDYFVRHAHPAQISRVLISVKHGLSAKEIAQKKKFYKKELAGIPFRFV